MVPINYHNIIISNWEKSSNMEEEQKSMKTDGKCSSQSAIRHKVWRARNTDEVNLLRRLLICYGSTVRRWKAVLRKSQKAFGKRPDCIYPPENSLERAERNISG